MKKWTLNSTARIVLDHEPAFVFGCDGPSREPLHDEGRIEGLYQLASLVPDALDDFVDRAIADENPAVHMLIETGLIVPWDTAMPRLTPRDAAFALAEFVEMRTIAEAAKPQVRDVVTIFDDILPEAVRYSIDVWSRGLAYRRVDIDRPDARDLHWIHALLPCENHVRALPFLRIFDDIVRRHNTKPLRVMRAYLYAGQASDTYRTHADSEDPDDITAIYYPARWQDHWGGELIFYDDGEPRWAVTPRGNRLILFSGARPHRVAPVGIAAEVARCSLVLRYGPSLDSG